MNVMLFSRILAKTGVGNHINLLSDALQKQGHNIWVVSGTQDIPLNNKSVKFIKVNTLSKKPTTVFKTIWQLNKIIKENNIDIVHCHHRVAAIFMRLYNVFFKIPYIYTLHASNIPHDFLHRFLTFPGKRAIGVSTEVSDFLKNKLKIPANKVVTVLNGVDDIKLKPLDHQEKSSIKEEWNIPQKNFIIAMHSRIDEVKNHILVVDAINKLSDEEKANVTVVCSGEKTGSYYNKVIELIKEYGLEDSFRFVGWVDTQKILGVADFLFLPSHSEGFPLSVIESFLLNVPVARTKTGGFYDMKYCLPISSTNPDDMVCIIQNVLRNGTNEYQQQIENAYNFAKKNLTSKEMAAKTFEIYREVCR